MDPYTKSFMLAEIKRIGESLERLKKELDPGTDAADDDPSVVILGDVRTDGDDPEDVYTVERTTDGGQKCLLSFDGVNLSLAKYWIDDIAKDKLIRRGTPRVARRW